MVLSLAPMASITHAGLRRLINDFAPPDEYFTEMIHAPTLISGNQFESWYLRTSPDVEKLVWQITSPLVDPVVKSIPLLLKKGGIGVDLNMGCCAPQIVKQGAGFGWMLKSDEDVTYYVRQVRNELDKFSKDCCSKHFRLSVKLRLGISEDYSFLLRFSKMLENEGVDLITLHPRLQRQAYSKPAMHKFIAMLANDLDIPVYGNGDVDSFNSFIKLKNSYPCSGWMIGRAVVQKPWFFCELKNKTFTVDLFETAIRFLDYLEEEQPEDFFKTRRQRFFAYYADNFKFAHYLKSKLLNAISRIDIENILSEYLDNSPSERFLFIK